MPQQTSPQTELSFVVPALNEEKHIGQTVRSIFEIAGAGRLVEVVVVDHGSTDASVAVAEAAGARVVVQHGGNIGGMRNLGAQHTTGRVLVFVDADVTLTPEWGAGIDAALSLLSAEPRTLTGSMCQPPESHNLLERYWFSAMAAEPNVRHLGSAHMICSRELFELTGGFSEELTTGEDSEFCHRVVDNGGRIDNNRKLKVIHHDFPRTISRFVRREIWHGKGGLESWALARRSKVVWATTVFVGCHVAFLVALPVAPAMPILPVLPLAGLAALLGLSSHYKFRHRPISHRAINAGIFYFYYVGRTGSMLYRLAGK